ncbi:MAG: DUF2183 domain-containing protein [Rhodobacterales bacterium]|nr:DUF2183 domain-containing protein [Rhodobacterales bacterium]
MRSSRPPGFTLRFLLMVERMVAGASKTRPGKVVIEPYYGYATPDGRFLRGRVLRAIKTSDPRQGQKWTGNLRQMTRLFLTRELPGVTVTACGVATKTDGEGYFNMVVPAAPGNGWQDVPIAADRARTTASVLVPRTDARFGVISDIDDTLIHTGAWSLFLNLKTTLTGNIETRIVFPDAVALIARLSEAGRNPVFYVSSTPWNMHGFLIAVFERAGLVRGPFFLRDLGLGEKQVIAGSHGRHKGEAIDRLLDANPDLHFILLGDTGQHDAQIYAVAATRHPGRVSRVILRNARKEVDAVSVAALEEQGVKVDVVDDFLALLGEPWPREDVQVKSGPSSVM